MREQNNIPTNETENWDDGTYQTGTAQPGKNQSGVIAGLLAATIFLGGIASALGLMNVRLLRQLQQSKEPVLPVTADATVFSGDLLRENTDPTPSVPGNGQLQLQTGDVSSVLTAKSPEEQAAAVTVRLTVVDSLGQCRTGPALVLSADGYLLTNAHLTDSALTITAQLPEGQTVRAALVACDPYSDLAVVYVDAQGLIAAAFAREGQPAAGRTPGPVFDNRGRVTGFRGLELKSGEMKTVTTEQLAVIAAQLVQSHCVAGQPDLGVHVRAMSHFTRQYWNLDHGIEILSSRTDSLLSGDILLRMNGHALTTCHQLHRLLLDVVPGTEVELEVFRAGQRLTVTVPVTTNP